MVDLKIFDLQREKAKRKLREKLRKFLYPLIKTKNGKIDSLEKRCRLFLKKYPKEWEAYLIWSGLKDTRKAILEGNREALERADYSNACLEEKTFGELVRAQAIKYGKRELEQRPYAKRGKKGIEDLKKARNAKLESRRKIDNLIQKAKNSLWKKNPLLSKNRVTQIIIKKIESEADEKELVYKKIENMLDKFPGYKINLGTIRRKRILPQKSRN